eukprot:TRINITY_DN7906_c0_g2_i1.p1 TRINITY_DN7906_c0_g2~~TRINITY_DN7906_c0_g2_i1.p1  ORF type:complete len:451 (+),score=54.34 TRINITY_DN7906_c0_g2_i1:158-1510(+)
MGSHMSRPKTEKVSEDGGSLSAAVSRFGVSSMQGWRQSMEDAHVACTDFGDGEASVYGVFDGHGGHAVSAWVSRYFLTTLEEELREIQIAGPVEADNSGNLRSVAVIKKSLTRGFLAMDEKMRQEDIRKEISDLHVKLLPKTDGSDGAEDQLEDPQASLLRYIKEYAGNRAMDGVDEGGKPTIIGPPLNGLNEEKDSSDDETDDTEEAQLGAIASATNDNGENALLQNGSPEGCGATAVVAYISSGNPRRLYVANAGDSRCVLSRAGKAVEMSRDHKPTLDDEDHRIRKAGGCVIRGRVDGNLNLSRALGDLYYKRDAGLKPEEQRITANPELEVIELTDEDEFVILACDGIWDCLTSQDCVDYVRQKLFACRDTTEEPVLSRMCEDLCDHCLAEDIVQSEGIGCDNMTAMICQLAVLSKIKSHAAPPAEVPQVATVRSSSDEDGVQDSE